MRTSTDCGRVRRAVFSGLTNVGQVPSMLPMRHERILLSSRLRHFLEFVSGIFRASQSTSLPAAANSPIELSQIKDRLPDATALLLSPLIRFAVPNLTYIFVREPCYAFLVVQSTKGANHGMDRTEARRDRPQLRNQLVRERRALIEFHFLRLPLSVSKSATAAF